MPDRPRLHPLPVSWEVSPSVPLLRLTVAESDENRTPTAVELFANHKDGSTVRMRLVFRSGVWIRWSPAFSDAEVVPEVDYDWSAVARLSVGADYRESRRRREEMWARTGLCPDPGAYEVHSSPWLREVNSTRVGWERYRHFLVLGHDEYVEVLAKDWEAEELAVR